MRRLLTILFLLFGAGLTSLAAEPDDQAPFRKAFSLEIGTGTRSVFLQYPSFTAKQRQEFTEKGQQYREVGTIPICLSACYHIVPHLELVLSGSIAWYHYDLTQYPAFGTDPYGRTRYDYQAQGAPLGRVSAGSVENLYFQFRAPWLFDGEDAFYSSIGVGLATNFDKTIPTFGFTLLGIRVAGKHFYGFGEFTVSPLATLFFGGLGWRF